MKIKNKIFIILPLLLASCNPVNNSNDIVEIQGNLQMEVNSTQQLTLSKEIDNVIWSSSNDFIARVKNGLVTAYNVGNVIIEAKYDDKVASFNIEVIKSLNINSLNSLLSILNENNEASYQEIHYIEQASNSKTEEKLYRFNNNYYIDKKEEYTRIGQLNVDNSQEFYGEYNGYCYYLNIGNNYYANKKKIVEENAQDNEINKDDLNNKLNQSIYLKRFITTKFNDSYTGYVDNKDIIVESVIDKDVKTKYTSFSKHVWDNKVNCDYKTFTSNFVFDLNGKLKSIDYQFNNYGDDQYNIELDKLNDDAEVKEYSSVKIEFLDKNSLTTSPIVPTNYFVNEINQNEIKVGDILVNKNIKVNSYLPSTALDYDNIEIYDVVNPSDRVVISYEDGVYTASSQGEATLKIRMKNSLDVTYSLKVEVK